MSRDTHKLLYRDKEFEFLLKGLLTSSIPEPPVPTILNGTQVGNFQGIEFFAHTHTNQHPLLIADLISNTYFRLTYEKEDGRSATLGSSIISAPSFRLPSGQLSLIPQVARAEIVTTIRDEMTISLYARYGDLAEVIITKSYPTTGRFQSFEATVHTQFTTLKHLQLDRKSIGVDSFRLCSLSSMFADEGKYDANIIRASGSNGGLVELDLSAVEKRGKYLFPHRQPTTALEVIKGSTSTGRRNAPGSPDSPSIRAEIVDCSFSENTIGAQGYLSPSRNINDDSLSVWFEWLEVPYELNPNTQIDWTVTYRVFAPGAQ